MNLNKISLPWQARPMKFKRIVVVIVEFKAMLGAVIRNRNKPGRLTAEFPHNRINPQKIKDSDLVYNHVSQFCL
jgi:hypothetical protein